MVNFGTHKTGQCACGAVSFKVMAPHTYGACHCEMCRRWTGGVWMGVVCSEVNEINGNVTEWKSSRNARRGFCAQCGTSIWHKPKHSPFFTFGQGLFDDQKDWSLSREIFFDDKPKHYALSQNKQKAFTAWGTLWAFVLGRLPK